MRRRRRRTYLGSRSRDSAMRRLQIKNETQEEREVRIAAAREKKALRRSKETTIERELRLSRDRERSRLYRASKRTSKGKNNKRLNVRSDEMNSEMNDGHSIEFKYDPDGSLGQISVVRTAFLSNNTTKNATIRRLQHKNETEEQRAVRIAAAREKKALRRMRETSEERELRLSRDRERKRLARASKKPTKGKANNAPKRRSMRSNEIISDMNEGFSIEYNYDPVDSLGPISVVRADMCTDNINSDMNDDFTIEYKYDPADSLATVSNVRRNLTTNNINSDMNNELSIENNCEPVEPLGAVSVVCENCSALLWKGESKGLCCLPGNIKLEESVPPSEPQHSLQVTPWVAIKEEKGES